jgi:hypothetical protein
MLSLSVQGELAMSMAIWPYGKDFYKVYVEDYRIKQKLEIKRNCKLSCRYFHKDGKQAWDFIFPAQLYYKVVKILKLPDKLMDMAKNSLESSRTKMHSDFTQANSAGLSVVER